MPTRSRSEMMFSKNWKEYRKNLYHLKLLGFMWFKGNLPEEYNGNFKIHFNMYRSEEEPPRGAEDIDNIGEDLSEYLCSILGTPEWVNNPKRDKIFSLDIMDDFPLGPVLSGN